MLYLEVFLATSGANYVDVVKKLIQFRVFNGIKVTNCGVGGETAAVVAARAGAESYRLYIENTVTLSDASVPISIAHKPIREVRFISK